MKVRFLCDYYRTPNEKVGEYGEEKDLTPEEAEPLLKGGSAVLIEPVKKSERD